MPDWGSVVGGHDGGRAVLKRHGWRGNEMVTTTACLREFDSSTQERPASQGGAGGRGGDIGMEREPRERRGEERYQYRGTRNE